MMLVNKLWVPRKCSGIYSKNLNLVFLAQSSLIHEKEPPTTSGSKPSTASPVPAETSQTTTIKEVEEITTEAIEPQTPT